MVLLRPVTETKISSSTFGQPVYDYIMANDAVRLTGVAGDYIASPNVPHIAGDLCIVVDVAVDDWTPSTQRMFVTRYSGSALGNAWYFSLSTIGTLSLAWSSDGTAIGIMSSTVPVPVTDGTRATIAVTFDVDNGASQRVCRFWYSLDNGATFTQLGTTVTQAVATSIYPTLTQVEIGSWLNGTAGMLAGTIYSVSIRDGIGPGGVIGGTEVARFDPALGDWAGAIYTDPYARVWTHLRPSDSRGPRWRTGYWYGQPAFAVSSGIPGEGVGYATIVEVPDKCRLDSLATEVTVAGSAGAVVRLGVYRLNNGNNGSVLLADAGTFDGTVVGTFELPINVPPQNSPYYGLLAMTVQGLATTRPTMRTVSLAQFPPFGRPTLAGVLGVVTFGAYITTGAGAYSSTLANITESPTAFRVMVRGTQF